MSLATNTEALQALLEAVRELPEFALPKKTSITFVASAWTQKSGAFEQTVTVDGGTANSLVLLQPTAEQIVAFQEAGVSALMVNNNNGAFIACSVGAAPSTDVTVQATLMEVKE